MREDLLHGTRHERFDFYFHPIFCQDEHVLLDCFLPQLHTLLLGNPLGVVDQLDCGLLADVV